MSPENGRPTDQCATSHNILHDSKSRAPKGSEQQVAACPHATILSCMHPVSFTNCRPTHTNRTHRPTRRPCQRAARVNQMPERVYSTALCQISRCTYNRKPSIPHDIRCAPGLVEQVRIWGFGDRRRPRARIDQRLRYIRAPEQPLPKKSAMHNQVQHLAARCDIPTLPRAKATSAHVPRRFV